ncbi:MAG: ABC transporter permease [Thermomicrobiales bacterium]|nr:ABC transporter permease [Thermomicrobiales bacterium]
MLGYIVRRLILGIPVLIIISAIVFLVTYLIPGDPAMVVLGQGASPDALEAVRHRLGLDQPVLIRYLYWLRDLLHGDLGQSVLSRQPVWKLIGHSLPITLYLTAFSMLIAVLIAIPLGTISALRRNTWVDVSATTWAFAGVSLPSFWLAMMLLYVFGVRLRWVPLQGYINPRDDLGMSLRTMILPALTLGVFLSGPLTRYLRSSVLQTLSQEYVQVARAKGLSGPSILGHHILRNSLIPFLTVLGIQFGYLLGGAVVVENVFALPGIGDLAVSAIGNRDFPVIQGVTLVVAVAVVLVNLLVDIVCALLDPRIRLSGGS